MPPRILIVDDEERFRLTLSKRLGERGLEVGATVGTGMEALREIREKAYDVVVLDVKMPGLDGIQTLEEIKKINPHIEVLLLTGHASVDAAVDGMRLGAYDYLMKPCEIEVLLDKINGAYEIKAGREERIRQAEMRGRADREPA
ncbi:MAG: response regulator [Desulfobacterota bacterium]|jgi:DNA-binding NtrC family response regulator|nr:response regulator [Thermodesulfobacteriota bacterium]